MITHPIGSERFCAWLDRLGVPAPWRLSEEETGELLAANGAIACTALDASQLYLDSRASEAAALIMCAINTLAGYEAVKP